MTAPFVGAAPPPPNKRPACPQCKVSLRPRIHTTSERVVGPGGVGFSYQPKTRSWDGKYDSYGQFCTLRCCEAFANAAWRAGYRIQGAS